MDLWDSQRAKHLRLTCARVSSVQVPAVQGLLPVLTSLLPLFPRSCHRTAWASSSTRNFFVHAPRRPSPSHKSESKVPIRYPQKQLPLNSVCRTNVVDASPLLSQAVGRKLFNKTWPGVSFLPSTLLGRATLYLPICPPGTPPLFHLPVDSFSRELSNRVFPLRLVSTTRLVPGSLRFHITLTFVRRPWHSYTYVPFLWSPPYFSTSSFSSGHRPAHPLISVRF